MANRAYLSAWCRGYSEASMLDLFEKFLETAPLSAQWSGFTWLVIRAVDPAQTALLERDLRAHPLRAADVVTLAREHLHADSAYEVQAYWDLWGYDAGQSQWVLQPCRLELICYGEDYDESAYGEVGHFQADLGFEHWFTGHAGLLGPRPAEHPGGAEHHPAEVEFLQRMENPANLREYQEKTRENIRKLHDWVRRIDGALPAERYRLWSEGEENFEARLDEILAVL